MTILNEIIQYFSGYRYALNQIHMHGDCLKFETWFYNDCIKINDEFKLDTPDICFTVVKYERLGKTPYCFTLHKESEFMRHPKHNKLFNRLFAPMIFRACAKQYKITGKQK